MHGTLADERTGNAPDLRRIGLHPNYWHPLAVAKDLKKGKTLGVSFAGDPIVLVRTESGKVFALEDRCSHRQMPLSCGVVAGEVVKCCYHAWSFNAEGRCAIPYLPKDAQRPRGVRPYPCREAYGLIFVFPGDIALADQVPFPDLPEVDAPTHKTMFFTRKVNCHYSFMHENLMDMNHQFLHRRWLKRVKPTLLESRRADGLVEAKYKFELTEGEAPLGAKIMLGGEQDDPANEKFDIMTVTTRYPYQTLQLRRPEDDENVLDLWSDYVPLDREQRTHQTFGFLSIRKPDRFAFLLTAFWPVIRYFTESVFTEDRFAVEMEQRAWDAQGADWNQEILPFIMDLRALLVTQGVPINARASGASFAQAAE
ncbi:MAG: aromatic ring-hydroxylating dioxygenase subunit alpha [Pseudorhodoplanes sp.]|nr:aromatic ring-hydroxylating dioxygenase subunit alpha [Pseudorhodoplanes sp.]